MAGVFGGVYLLSRLIMVAAGGGGLNDGSVDLGAADTSSTIGNR
jgi:hypothetical protein